MKKLALLTIALQFLFSSFLRADSAPAATELSKLLQEFLARADDAPMHERFWADDLIYTSSTGRRIGKADILREVRAEAPPKPGDETTVYTADDIRIQQYGDTAIVAFRLIATSEKDGAKKIRHFLNTGTFLECDGQWRAVSWQATVMPEPTDAKS